jgi:chromosome condensin MukBEF complex kleisin-like MukF subunit
MERGLDARQEQVRKQIGELLEVDWFAAVERCWVLRRRRWPS